MPEAPSQWRGVCKPSPAVTADVGDQNLGPATVRANREHVARYLRIPTRHRIHESSIEVERECSTVVPEHDVMPLTLNIRNRNRVFIPVPVVDVKLLTATREVALIDSDVVVCPIAQDVA